MNIIGEYIRTSTRSSRRRTASLQKAYTSSPSVLHPILQPRAQVSDPHPRSAQSSVRRGTCSAVRAGAYTGAHGSMRGLLLCLLALPSLAGKLLFGSLVAARNQLLDQTSALRLVVLIAVLELLEVGDALVGRHRGELGVDRVAVFWGWISMVA
jgi:hypothetical protein